MVTLVAALALVLTIAPALPSAVAAPDLPCTTAEKTVAAAAAMAKRCGVKVEIGPLRSEMEQTFARPIGGFTTERSVEPRWSRKPDGTWTGIDTSLRVSGGLVAPVASALPVEFSAGGSGPAARLRNGDRALAITWPFGALPAPTLSGSEATYAEVLPGVDLRLTASAVGFSEVLVVKSAQAAKNPKLAKVKFGFATTNVTAGVTSAGGLEAKDDQGRVVFTSPTPLMWDSTSELTAAKSAGEPGRGRVVTMPVTADNGELVVTPDAAMIADSATRYPIFIDPSWTGRLQNDAWTLVTSKLPNSAFWQGGGFLQNAGDLGAVGTGVTCDSYNANGNCLSPTYKVRSYFRMDVSALRGKSVIGASFRIEQRWASGCQNGGSGATARVTDDIGGGTTWNDQPQWRGDRLARTSPANHELGAPHGCAGVGDVEFEMTGAVEQAVVANRDHITFVIHVDESSVSRWKRFNAATPVLAVDYNSPPNTPDQLSVDGKPCATGANRPATPTASPTLRARVSDPDSADTMAARFEWARIRENGTIAAVEHQDGSPFGNGTTAETTIAKPASLPAGVLDRSDTLVGTGDGAVDVVAQRPDAPDLDLHPGVVGTTHGGQQWPIAGRGVTEGAYVYRARAGDWQGWGSPSSWCEFAVDVTAPAAPTITASVYKPTGCDPEGCGSSGVADTFTFASTSSDVVKYRWGFTDPPSTTVTAPSAGAAASVTWTPSSAGRKTLYVEAVDRAGLSTRTTYGFTVASPSIHSGQWMYGDVPDSDTSGSGHDLTLVGVAQGLPGRLRGGFPAVGFDGTTTPTVSTTKVLDTDRGFTASAWVRLTDDTADRAVISQQGTSTSAFRLGYVAAQHKWAFSVAEADAVDPVQRQVLSDSAARTGVWTHLTAVYESANREVRLYVDGALQFETTVVSAGFDAEGELWIGRRLLGGAAAEPWQGEFENVRVWGRAITQQEISAMVDPVGVSRVGSWSFNEASGRTALDHSRFAHDLTLTPAPGAIWGAGHEDSGLHLDGTGSAQSNESVLNTDQSFSVDVWARLASPGVERTVVVQRGPSGVDPFTLRYDGTRWSVDMPDASTNPTTWWRARSTADAAVDTWTHLSVAYDASARTLSLWVDDSLQSTVTGVVGWNHDGLLTVGRGSAGANWLGDLDDLSVFQSALNRSS